MPPSAPVSFVLAATVHGPMIVNRHDHALVDGRPAYGVGHQLLETGAFDADEVSFVMSLLKLSRRVKGDGAVFLDAGANIGVFTVEAARLMRGWGTVHAFEPQAPIFHALGGNLALSNLFNVTTYPVALGPQAGTLRIPRLDYESPGSYGSLELIQPSHPVLSVGQAVDYSDAGTREVRCMALDELDLVRADVLKLDVESMEEAVLRGARQLLARCRPLVWVEILKSGAPGIQDLLEPAGYRFFELGANMLAVPTGVPAFETHIWMSADGVLCVRD